MKEGSAYLITGENDSLKGPGRVMPGFYNRSQKLNRDLTIAFLKALRPSHFLDAFGATGVRGIRAELEAGVKSTISETNPISLSIIEKNCEINKISPTIFRGPFQKAIMDGLYDFIDLDPYGSVVPYLDIALRQVKRGGFIGVTATDLSSLTGSVPAKTRRRYWASVCNDRLRHETGVRVLLASIGKRAAAIDRGIFPIISFWRGHYYRLIFRVEEGAAKADRTLQMISTLSKHSTISEIYADIAEGPLWSGNIEDKELIPRVSASNILDFKTAEFLSKLPSEDLMVWFYEMADFCHYMKTSLPPIATVIRTIYDQYGIPAERTMFSPTGIKLPSRLDIMDVIKSQK
ncbi:MAG: N2,N2-dimethylguanosine tRNA methyltransferase [Thermoplasmataceae archaeon]